MSVILAVCVGYTVVGGLHAVIGTDFVQSLIVLIGIVVVAIAVLGQVDIATIHANLASERPALLDVLFPAALMGLFNNLLFGLGEIVHGNVWWSRALAMRAGVGRRAYLLAGLIWLPVPILAGFLGLAASSVDVAIVRPDMVGPLLAAELLGSVGAILVFVVVFASLASSIDSLLAASSDLVVHELIARVDRNADEARRRRQAGGAIVLLGGLTWLLCMPKIGSLASVLFFAGPLVGSTIWPVLAGLYWRDANPRAAVLALALGSLLGLAAHLWIGWYVGALVATAVSLVITLAGRLLAPRRFDWARLRELEVDA